MLIVIRGFPCIYKCIFLVIIFNFKSLVDIFFFPWETGGSMFCTAFLSRKSNLLDFSIKIGTQPGLSWFDQSLVISCLLLSSVKIQMRIFKIKHKQKCSVTDLKSKFNIEPSSIAQPKKERKKYFILYFVRNGKPCFSCAS